MAIGLSHVACSARHVGKNRGRAHFCPLPTHHHGINDSTESTGFDNRRHRPVSFRKLIRRKIVLIISRSR